MSNIVLGSVIPAKNRTIKIGPCFCVAASWLWKKALAESTVVGAAACLGGNTRASEQVELNSINN